MPHSLTHGLVGPVRARLLAIPRGWKIAVGVLVGLYVSYLVAANVILRTHLLRGWVNGDPIDGMVMEYGSAWSILPGRVHISGFTLRFENDDVRFFLKVDHAVTDVDLFALTKRTFKSTKTTADGVSFFMRLKMKDPKGSEGRIAAFPPIKGFDPSELAPTPNPPKPPSDRVWTVEMANVAATTEELWALEYHFKGNGNVAGAFHLKPQRELWLSPSILLAEGGTLYLGEKPAVENCHLKLEVRIDDFDVSGPTGLEIMRHFDARADLAGEVPTIQPFGETYLPPEKGVKLERGRGPVTMQAHMDHGLLMGGETKIDWQTKDVRILTPVGAFEGDAHFVSKVDGVREDGVLVADTSHKQIAWAPKNETAVVATDAVVGVRLDNADVSRDFRVVSLTGKVAQAKAADLTKLQSVMPADVVVQGGSGVFSGRFGYHGGALDARADATLEKAKVKSGTFDANASGKLWATVKSADVDKLISFPELGADLKGVGVHLDGQAADDCWLKLVTTGAAHRPDGSEGSIKLTAGPGDRLLRFGAGAAGIPKEAADLASGSELTASMRLKMTKTETAFTLEDARDGKLEAKGRLAKAAEGKLRGAFLIELGPLSAGVLVDRGKASVRPMVGKTWLDQN